MSVICTLPIEIIERILLFTDISTCILLNNLYCVKKIYNPYDWNHFAYHNQISNLRYLHVNSIGTPDYDVIIKGIANGGTELIKFLIEINLGSELALDYAIEIGSLKVVKLLVNSYVPISDNSTEDALTYDHFEIFEFLINSGAEIGASMYTACALGSLEAVKFMIIHGEHPDTICLEDAITNGHLDIVKFLIDTVGIEPNENSVEDSVISKNIDLINYLISLNLPLGNSLYYSINDIQFDIMLVLLRANAEITKDCMFSAISNNLLDFAETLVLYGFEITDEIIAASVENETEEIEEFLTITKTIAKQKN